MCNSLHSLTPWRHDTHAIALPLRRENGAADNFRNKYAALARSGLGLELKGCIDVDSAFQDLQVAPHAIDVNKVGVALLEFIWPPTTSFASIQLGSQLPQGRPELGIHNDNTLGKVFTGSTGILSYQH